MLVENRWLPPAIHIHECIYFIMSSPGKLGASAFISLPGHQIEQSEALCQSSAAVEIGGKHVKGFSTPVLTFITATPVILRWKAEVFIRCNACGDLIEKVTCSLYLKHSCWEVVTASGSAGGSCTGLSPAGAVRLGGAHSQKLFWGNKFV